MLGASGRLYGHGVTYRYWPLASGLGEQVEVTGFDACLPLFGLPGR